MDREPLWNIRCQSLEGEDEMISIIIVDDEVLSRIGIQSFVDGKKDISVGGVFGLASDALSYLKDNHTDIVITDIEMANMNGLEFIQEIRNQKVADGIIILSCHDNFEYAREAISLGTDSFILKHNVNEQILLDEIYKVYEKTSRKSDKNTLASNSVNHVEENGIYIIGAVKFRNTYLDDEILLNGQVEENMLVHLLEGIIKQYHMGTLFAPYKKDMFIIFRFETDMVQSEREMKVNEYIHELRKNIDQYVNKSLILGLSMEFSDLGDIPKCYHDAVLTSELSFYDETEYIFMNNNIKTTELPTVNFVADNFLDEEGIENFMWELDGYLTICQKNSIEIQILKQTLIHNVNMLVYQVLNEYCFEVNLIKKWNSKYQIMPVIMTADSTKSLKYKLKNVMVQFQEELLDQLRKDEFSGVFQYIDSNISLKHSLTEIANMNCMSIPSFCKKFKERTDMTLMQYINQQKIDRVKIYLRNHDYTLEKIAEMTGFSNENYMIRVFKKVTGQTVKDYRSDYNDI